MMMKKIMAMIVGIIIFGMSGCVRGERVENKNPYNTQTLVSSVFMGEIEAENLRNVVPIRLYFVSAKESDKLKMEVQYIPLNEASLSSEGLVGVILKELLNGPENELELQKIMVEGIALKREPEYQDSVVTLDFNEDFFKELEKDSRTEDLVIFSIVNSLTEVKEVERVKFLQNGKSVENYQGKRNMDALFHRNPDLISKKV
jgi:germination protein M